MKHAALEKSIRARLEKAPTLAKDIELPRPEVSAPSLDDLVIRLEAPLEPTDEELAIVLMRAQRICAQRRTRARGEAVGDNDDVIVDLVGHVAGRVLPFSARRAALLAPENDRDMPRLRAALVGAPVGASRTVTITMPDDAADGLAGVAITYVVEIKEATEVIVPTVDDPEFLASIGASSVADLPEVLGAIAGDAAADEIEEELEARLMDELAARVGVELTDAWIDQHVRKLWGENEGVALIEKGVTVEAQEASLQEWLKNPMMRARAEHELRVSFALGAVQEQLGIQVDATDVDAALESLSQGWGEPVESVQRRLQTSPDAQRRVIGLISFAKAMDAVRARARVEIVPV